MDNSSSKQCFRPHKRVKTELSQRENTARTRKWERSLVGLESALFKIGRNQRVAISRERKRMQEAPVWSTLTSSEKSQHEAAMVARITAKYQKEKDQLIARQNEEEDSEEEDDNEENDNEENDNEEDDDNEEAETEFETDDVGEEKEEENEVHTSEADEMDSEFETDEDEGGGYNNEELSDEQKAILHSSIADIYRKAFRDIGKAVNQFEEWGSYDEDPVED